jgi:hypothetical protein
MTTTTTRMEELRALPYEDYLKTSEWRETRQRILERDKHQCQVCKASDVLLIVHHYTLERQGAEEDTDLVTLCQFCRKELLRLLADPPKLSFLHKCVVGLGVATVGTIGIEGLLQAPLPAELGVLIVAFLVAKNSPLLWGKLKESLPTEVMVWLGNAPKNKGLVSTVNVWLGRTPAKVVDADREAENKENDLVDYMREQGITEEDLNESLAGGRLSVHDIEDFLRKALKDFQIRARVEPSATAVGPRIIQFGVVPTGVPEKLPNGQVKRDDKGHIVYAKRTRVEEIRKREEDIQLALGATSIRILSPVRGKHYVGIEIPNPEPTFVPLADILKSQEYKQACASSKLVFALGCDVTGRVRFCDIEKAPHILIGGATNMGKSVLINVLIASLLHNATPHDVRLLMVDPKQVELTPYNGIPHLLRPVITDMTKVVPMLEHAIHEMERRYQIFASLGVRKLSQYRQMRGDRLNLENLPAWVIIVDEFADLVMTASKEDDIEGKICRLAQKARATGIHLIIATQKPVVKVITGLIKSNLPTSIALKTKTEGDSRVILDQGGAECLLGDGDMLYLPPNSEEPIRIQGAYMTDTDTEQLIARWQTNKSVIEQDEDVQTEPLRLTSSNVVGRIQRLRAKGRSPKEIALKMGIPYNRVVAVLAEEARPVSHSQISTKIIDFEHEYRSKNGAFGEQVNVVNGPAEPSNGIGNVPTATGNIPTTTENIPAATGNASKITEAHKVAVLRAVFELQKAGVPVTRTALRDHLGWTNRQFSDILKPICDEFGIATQGGK